MNVADLIELLQQCDTPTARVTVRVWDGKAEEPVFSACDIRDCTEQRGVIVVDCEER